MKRLCLAIFILTFCRNSIASPFDDAAIAARDGRYQEVVRVLSVALQNPAISEADRLAALTNRGIAYSLLGGFDLARKDFGAAIERAPDYPLALNQMGVLAEQVDKSPDAAAALYEKAASLGFTSAAVNLARLYRTGTGVATDAARALALYLDAAEQGHSAAFGPVGEMYFDGEGTGRNTRVAVEWLQRAADAGSLDASFYLGRAYESGAGVAQDLSKAARLYESAAAVGNVDAQNSLGYLYRSGGGVKQDFDEAVKWYRLAADQGLLEARNRLAWLLAACPTKEICNGEEALRLARGVVAQDAEPGHLDTLAAALARAGQFEEAIDVQSRAIAAMPSGSGARGRYERRLARYRRSTPFQL